jgi:hypothetical protein
MRVADTPKAQDGVLAQEAHGKTVLLRLADGGYYALEDVGAFIWERCDGRHTLNELVAAVMAEFDGTPDAVWADVVAFLEELSDENLLASPE